MFARRQQKEQKKKNRNTWGKMRFTLKPVLLKPPARQPPFFFSCYDRAAPRRDFIFFSFQSLNSCLFSVRQAKDVPLRALGCGGGVRLRPQFGVGVLGQPHLQRSQQQGDDARECPVRHLRCRRLLLFHSVIGCNRHKNVPASVINSRKVFH